MVKIFTHFNIAYQRETVMHFLLWKMYFSYPALKSNIDDFALYQGHKMFLSMDMFQCGLNFEISNGIAIS